MANSTLTLQSRKKVADGTELFAFDKPADFQYEAGQYVALVLNKKLLVADMRGPVRSFSLSSAPFESEIFFTMRQGQSGFKQTIFTYAPGDTIMVTKPIGKFTLSHASDGKPIVFLVGGIGITPVRSILKQAEHEGIDREFILIYSNRFEKDAAFHDELSSLKLKNYRYVTTLSQETTPCTKENEERGYICEEMVRKYVSDIQGVWYYLVGAPAFIETMEAMLEKMEVPKERQESDPFTGLTRPDDRKK